MRLQEYAVGLFLSAASKSAIKKAIKKNRVTIDDRVATTANYVTGGEHIRLTHDDHSSSVKVLKLSLKVIYEDEHLAVIHKPAGILVSGNRYLTIANALPQNLERSPLIDATRAQPVHRLDYATTGALLVGKTSSSISALNKMFEHKEIKKVYYAIAIGLMNPEGVVDDDVDGKESLSKYSVIDSVRSRRFGRLNLIQLIPHTGRRHQLRQHLLAIGHPILGDQKYYFPDLILRGKGMYLHAHSLSFIHPYTKRAMQITDELPHKYSKIFGDIAMKHH